MNNNEFVKRRLDISEAICNLMNEGMNPDYLDSFEDWIGRADQVECMLRAWLVELDNAACIADDLFHAEEEEF